jgi:hypothetical protein
VGPTSLLLGMSIGTAEVWIEFQALLVVAGSCSAAKQDLHLFGCRHHALHVLVPKLLCCLYSVVDSMHGVLVSDLEICCSS